MAYTYSSTYFVGSVVGRRALVLCQAWHQSMRVLDDPICRHDGLINDRYRSSRRSVKCDDKSGTRVGVTQTSMRDDPVDLGDTHPRDESTLSSSGLEPGIYLDKAIKTIVKTREPSRRTSYVITRVPNL